jgi:hypothetical protein
MIVGRNMLAMYEAVETRHNTFPGAGEIGSGSQAIVASSDNDGIVLHTGVQAG